MLIANIVCVGLGGGYSFVKAYIYVAICVLKNDKPLAHVYSFLV